MTFEIKFGEHYYTNDESSFWISLLITIIGSFLGFFLALWLDRKADKRNIKRKEREDNSKRLNVIKYLDSNISGVLDYIPKQLSKYDEYTTVLKKTPLENSYPEIVVTYDLLRLRNMDNVETQEAYFRLFKGLDNPVENYKNLFAHSDYIFKEFESIVTQTEKSINFKHADQKSIKQLLDEISFVMIARNQEIVNSIPKKDLKSNTEFVFLDTILSDYEYIINESMSYKLLRENIVLPLLMKSPKNVQDKTTKIQVLKLARIIEGKLSNIEFNTMHFVTDVENLKDKLQESIDSLKISQKSIREKINVLQQAV